ncbi:phage tail protein [Pseudomonas panipatensis]|jgi:phage-related protein|uniref:Phage-related protein n=1 Tax=Pseudomonas panipatensis TaxID=428992 RepID=A0A1G8HKY8_9PSED|nr:phage tail protein [Pseudomonas panipatensis]SDI07242.1 Phage-related protein [Pseudomonas panipatensis]SMP58906.1 Phage-related protein [Pseudomonas panipatensis]
MTEVFSWDIAVSSTGTINQSVREAKFGDGYSQAVGDGINNEWEVWEISRIGRKALIDDIRAFFRRHGGWKSFSWTSPSGMQGLFRCSNIQLAPHGAGKFTISATFTQVGDYPQGAP